MVTRAIKQHYVPQFLLRGFARNEKRSQVHVFDKREHKIYSASIRNVASRNRFYDLHDKDRRVSFEPTLAELDGQASGAIGELLRTKQTAMLSDKQRSMIAYFLAVQFVRGEHFRANTLHINKQMGEWLRKLGFDPNEVVNYHEMDEVGAKQMAIEMLTSAHEFVPFMLDKTWVLHTTDSSNPFLISDNPLALSLGDQKYGPEIGLGSRSIIIQMPLTMEYSLGSYCPTYLEDALQLKLQMKEFMRQKVIVPGLSLMQEKVNRLYEAFAGTEPFICDSGLVKWLNANQIIQAERFIYSSTRDFALAKTIMRENPRYRSGPRGGVGWPKASEG